MNYWLWLATLENVGSVRVQSLLRKFKDPERIYKASKKELLEVEGIGEKISENILKNKDEILISRMSKYMENNGIYQVSICDKNYPEALKNIYDPPITLFYKGDIKLANTDCVSIVGSRNASTYGRETAFKIGKDLAQKGYTIVSGMAQGIDTEAHRGALDAEGKTIAVVGTGLDRVYPLENYKLCKKIEEKGLVLSEYVVGTRPDAMNFPARNRIISGLSDNLIVVEAARRSGALITVDLALEQGKNVYAVPRKYKFTSESRS
ncbi:MAG: DNA-processing protein DprA [Clostridia bacterium]|nr:DNA-processing protein DprA [Clostridia bacterium]